MREFVTEQYKATNLQLHPGYSPLEVRKQDNGLLTILLADKEGNKCEITDNDQVFMATGRAPKVSGLGLENVGVKLGKSTTGVDWYRTGECPRHPGAMY